MNQRPRHIHITGASGSGTTTLGNALAQVLPAKHEKWLELITCPILRIDGDTTIEDRMERVINSIKLGCINV